MSLDVEAWVNKLNVMKSSEIRDLMVEEGVQADTCAPTMCALSELIRQKTGVEVMTLNDTIGVVRDMKRDVDTLDVVFTTSFSLESGVRLFINRFDNGEYPELISPASDCS